MRCWSFSAMAITIRGLKRSLERFTLIRFCWYSVSKVRLKREIC